MPRGPATFRGPVGPGRAHSQHCQLYFGSVGLTALYMRARDRSAQGPGFSLGGPVQGHRLYHNLSTHSEGKELNIIYLLTPRAKS